MTAFALLFTVHGLPLTANVNVLDELDSNVQHAHIMTRALPFNRLPLIVDRS